MGNLSLRSSETPWKGGEVKLFGRVITGITGWELTKEVEKERSTEPATRRWTS